MYNTSPDFDCMFSESPEDFDSLHVEQETKQQSSTALSHDRWSMRRGKEWAATDVGSSSLRYIESDDERNCVAADVLAAAWEPSPVFAESCSCPERKSFLSSLLQSKEYQSLHRDTALDDAASEIAAASFANQLYKALAENTEDKSDVEKEASAQRHAREACKEAKEGVKEITDTRSALGIGKGSESTDTLSASEASAIFKKIRNNRKLRSIMDLAGKYTRLAQSMQSNKKQHGIDEVVGFSLSDDVADCLPSELALLSDEDTENLFYLKMVEQSLMIDEKMKPASTNGAIAIVVDESGSMRGSRIEHAKAIALSMVWIAKHQKRWACLVGFAGSTEGNFLVVKPEESKSSEVLAWIEHFYGGGTTMDVPLDVLPSKWEMLGCPKGATDIVQITDARVDVPEQAAARFNQWKSDNKVKMQTIVIGDDPGDLRHVSDKVFKIDSLGLDSEAVQSCLSI